MLQHLLIPNYMLLKNKLPAKDKMITSNNNKYVIKYYIKLFNIVPVKMESVQSFIDLAIALNGV